MAANAISQKAQSFLAQHIQSVEQLEIFLALGTEPERFLSAREIFQRIQSSEKSISTCLEHFSQTGLAVADDHGGYRLADQSDLLELVAELKQAYRERRVTVIEMIYKGPSDQIQSFADAFRIRKDS